MESPPSPEQLNSLFGGPEEAEEEEDAGMSEEDDTVPFAAGGPAPEAAAPVATTSLTPVLIAEFFTYLDNASQTESPVVVRSSQNVFDEENPLKHCPGALLGSTGYMNVDTRVPDRPDCESGSFDLPSDR